MGTIVVKFITVPATVLKYTFYIYEYTRITASTTIMLYTTFAFWERHMQSSRTAENFVDHRRANCQKNTRK